jgi:phospholipid/cholesterol/gamma-HCH transport system permease protein
VGLGLTRELAPTLAALMVCGRAGAGLATELGTMRITEQIDALETMAVSSIQYLVSPALVAGLLMLPLLTIGFDVIGMFGAYAIAVWVLKVDPGRFMDNFRWYVDPSDIIQGVIKAAVFGVIVTLIGCYQGYKAGGGAKGVGIATTRAVVVGSVSVLLVDYFLTDILNMLFPPGT